MAAMTIAAVLPAFGVSGAMRVRKLGDFDVDADGRLSLDGQYDFQMYGEDGGLLASVMEYRLVGDRIEAREISTPSIKYPNSLLY